MFKLQHSNTPILQHSKAHGYVPDVQLILAAMDLSSYSHNFIKRLLRITVIATNSKIFNL